MKKTTEAYLIELLDRYPALKMIYMQLLNL